MVGTEYPFQLRRVGFAGIGVVGVHRAFQGAAGVDRIGPSLARYVF